MNHKNSNWLFGDHPKVIYTFLTSKAHRTRTLSLILTFNIVWYNILQTLEMDNAASFPYIKETFAKINCNLIIYDFDNLLLIFRNVQMKNQSHTSETKRFLKLTQMSCMKFKCSKMTFHFRNLMFPWLCLVLPHRFLKIREIFPELLVNTRLCKNFINISSATVYSVWFIANDYKINQVKAEI